MLKIGAERNKLKNSNLSKKRKEKNPDDSEDLGEIFTLDMTKVENFRRRVSCCIWLHTNPVFQLKSYVTVKHGGGSAMVWVFFKFFLNFLFF